MIFLSVFLLSFSTFIYEVTLTRVFSITQWHHLSFMVISIVLFGFAASGTCLSLFSSYKSGLSKTLVSQRSIYTILALYSMATLGSFILVIHIPLDYFRLPLEPVQVIYLLAVYLILTIPFFIAGFAISIAFSFIPQRTGFIYFLSMTGSALGSVVPALLISIIGIKNVVILSSIIPLLPLAFMPLINTKYFLFAKKNDYFLLSFSWLLLCSDSYLLFSNTPFLRIKPSQYKQLSQTLQFPDTHIISSHDSIRGRFDRVKSPYTRYAPGLSLNFTNPLPHQESVFSDGDSRTVLYNISSKENLSFVKFTLPYAGYIFLPHPERILIIHKGGGSAVPPAVHSNPNHITLLEQSSYLAETLRTHYPFQVMDCNPEAFFVRSDQHYDIIHIENWGTSIPGSSALTQDFTFTLESFRGYLGHLNEEGIIIMSRKLLLPPANTIRIWAVAYESLRSIGIKYPENHLIMLRNWDIFVLIVSLKPHQDLINIINFANDNNFDFIWFPGITRDMTNRYHVFKEPFHFDRIKLLEQSYLSGEEKSFFRDYIFDVMPTTTDRPFPDRFLKLHRVKEINKSKGNRLYTFLMSGEIVVAVVFFEALAVSVVLLIPPLMVARKKKIKLPLASLLYFLFVGFGFIFMEMFFIKKCVFLFGDPIISFTVVLMAILFFSGMGGFLSQKVDSKDPYTIIPIFLSLIAVLSIQLFIIDTAFRHILVLPVFFRYVFSFLFIMPAGILIGFPFPLGMVSLLENPFQRAHAWAGNGCASVLASVVSAQLALSFGISTIMICAILSYIVSSILFFKH